MLDIQLLRNDLDAVAARLATRGKEIDFSEFSALEAERKTLQTRTQELQASRNSLSKQIGVLKGKGEDASAVLAEVGADPGARHRAGRPDPCAGHRGASARAARQGRRRVRLPQCR